MTLCNFETNRLLGNQWSCQHATSDQAEELAIALAAMLTERVTRPLPQTWHGPYTRERARQWLDERASEGIVVPVLERSTGRLVGLVVATDVHEREVRLGYIVAEDMWGRGCASEIVDGFVGWCRGEDAISSIAAGVGKDNPASIRVLEKNGFVLVENEGEAVEGQYFYRLTIQSFGRH